MEKTSQSRSLTSNIIYLKKRRNLESDDQMAIQNEVEILSQVLSFLTQIDHPNIVKIMEVFDEKNKLYIVMELMTGGEVQF